MTDSKLNLDLIQMVQRARMAHDAAAVPSQVSNAYWIEAKPLQPRSNPTPHAGNWVILTTLAEVDGLWERIKQATQAGGLGYKAKVSTMPGPKQSRADARMILVSTFDADDAADVQRVCEALRALGVTAELQYQR